MPLTVAVEVGTRQIRAALLDPQDGRHRLPRLAGMASKDLNSTRISVEPDLVKAIIEMSLEVAGDRRDDVEAVGVCCSAAVDNAGKVAMHGAPEPSRSGRDQQFLYPLLRPLRDKLTALIQPDLRVAVANRSNMAAWGELQYGQGQSMHVEDLVFLSVGGIVGAGVVIHKDLVVGRFGFAGQYGHMLADPTSDVECGMCHHRGCLSSVVGGTALLRQLEARHGETGGAELLEYLSKNPTPNNQDAGQRRVINSMTVDARALVKAANIVGGRANGPRFPLAYDIVQKAAVPLGAAIGQIVCLLDPSIVVLGGILSNADYLEETLGDVARQYIPHFRRGRNHLVFTEFSDFAQTVKDGYPLCGDEAALYGTAHWVWQTA